MLGELNYTYSDYSFYLNNIVADYIEMKALTVVFTNIKNFAIVTTSESF
jgi:hypothetical protein